MKALLFDTETTGLVENRSLRLDKQPEIIEFYGCLADIKTGKVIEEYETLVRPKIQIREETVRGPKGRRQRSITEITGIDNEMVVDAPRFADVADRIFGMVEKAPMVIAHNLSFDFDMLEIEADRLGRQLNWPPKLCTVEQTIHLKGFRMSLGDLYEYLFEEKFSGAHRARADVEALFRCCREMVKRKMI